MSVKPNQSKPIEISFSINTNDIIDDNTGTNNLLYNINNEKALGRKKIPVAETLSSNRSSSFREDAINDVSLAEEEDSTISARSSLLMISSFNNSNISNNVNKSISNDVTSGKLNNSIFF